MQPKLSMHMHASEQFPCIKFAYHIIQFTPHHIEQGANKMGNFVSQQVFTPACSSPNGLLKVKDDGIMVTQNLFTYIFHQQCIGTFFILEMSHMHALAFAKLAQNQNSILNGSISLVWELFNLMHSTGTFW